MNTQPQHSRQMKGAGGGNGLDMFEDQKEAQGGWSTVSKGKSSGGSRGYVTEGLAGRRRWIVFSVQWDVFESSKFVAFT